MRRWWRGGWGPGRGRRGTRAGGWAGCRRAAWGSTGSRSPRTAPPVAGVLDPAKWSAVYQGGGLSGLSADVVAFDRITITAQGAAGPGGASTASYSNAPSDVSDTLGRTLAAFSDLPL